MAERAVKTAKAENYTSEMVNLLIARYEELGNDGLEAIAAEIGKPIRSVRSKLVREGVYVAAPKVVKAKRDEGPTKKELLNELEAIAPFSVEGLLGATKASISDVIAFVRSKAD
jgi:hypothetical protein